MNRAIDMHCFRALQRFTNVITHSCMNSGQSNGYVTRRTRRGTRAGRNVIRRIKCIVFNRPEDALHRGCGVTYTVQIQANELQISVRVTNREKVHSDKEPSGINFANLKRVEFGINLPRGPNLLSLCTLNCRSMKNKASSLCDYVTSNNLDILAQTETWLGTDLDNGVIANAHARLHTTAVRESAALHSGKELYTHSRVFPAGSAPRAFPHMLPSLRRKGPRYLIIYLFSAVYYALFIALCCDHRYRSHVHVRT